MKGFDWKKAVSSRTLVALGVGASLWIAVFIFSGPTEILTASTSGLKSFGIVMGLSAAAIAFRATAWKIELGVLGHRQVPLVAVLKASLAVGGAPVQLALLRSTAGVLSGAGSIALDRAVGALAALIFTGLGLFWGFLLTPGHSGIRGLMLIVAVSGFGYLIIMRKRWARLGFFTSLLKGGEPVTRRILSPAVWGRFDERDRFLNSFRKQHRGAYRMCLFIHLVILILGALEVLAIGRAIDDYFPPALSLALPASICLFRTLFYFAPAAFGFLEAALAAVLGLTFGTPLIPVGVAIVLLLRLKTLTWWVIGLSNGNPAQILFGRR